MTNHFFKLPFSFDETLLQTDLSVCEASAWKEHFNTNDYSGSWTAIALRSPSGKASDILAHPTEFQFADTPLLHQCNYFKKILSEFKFEKEAVRLLRLAPGSIIKEHRDMGLAYRFGEFRIHIPIQTKSSVSFLIGNFNVPMKSAECWYADFDLPHSVKNESDTERIHLVIDGKRNEWTDAIFAAAGYDFEKEKKMLLPEYDDETLDNMIMGLENIGTSTAKDMIADLKARKKNRSSIDPNEKDKYNLRKSIPSRLLINEGNIQVKWVYAGQKKFSEPFFSETIAFCKSFPETKQLPETSLEELYQLADETYYLEPSVFIFHISRCGSTLMTQMLSESEKCIVLSEVPILDDILRLNYQHPGLLNAADTDRLFKAVLRLHARKKTGRETHLFVKCDSWHTLFHKQLRRCFPETPIAMLYRKPMEVLNSQQKQPGMHAAQGLLPAELFGFDPLSPVLPKEKYLGNVLECYLKTYLQIANTDPNAHLLSYHSGSRAMLEQLMQLGQLNMDENEKKKLIERSTYHSKHPGQVFTETQPEHSLPESLIQSMHYFEQLERMRK